MAERLEHAANNGEKEIVYNKSDKFLQEYLKLGSRLDKAMDAL